MEQFGKSRYYYDIIVKNIDKIILITYVLKAYDLYVCIYRSTHRDFNRVLARQPPTSINIPRFEINSDLEQQILPDSLIVSYYLNVDKRINRIINLVCLFI